MRFISVKPTLVVALFAALCLLPETADAGPFRRRMAAEVDYTAYPCDCGGPATTTYYGSGLSAPGYAYSYWDMPTYYSYSGPFYYGIQTYGAQTYYPQNTVEVSNIPATNVPGGVRTASSLYTPGGTSGGGNNSATKMPGETTRIRMTDDTLDPAFVNLTTGMSVRWVNDGTRPQTVTSVNGDFDSGEIAPGKEFVAQFNRPGVFEYTSKNQKEFRGRIIVR